MREILFRGKRPNGEWAYGWYYPLRHDKDTITHYIVENPLPVLRGVKESVVDPATIGQFTGLTDKNGKKIFEGDILHVIEPMGTTTIVPSESGISVSTKEWGDEYNHAVTFTPSGLQLVDYYCHWAECEVVGNIYDSPELVEAKS